LTQTENNLLPTLTFYADFPEDWERFDDRIKKDIGGFLQHLQADPFDPRITEISEKNGGYYATRIGPVVVYWKLARREDSIEGVLAPPDSIYVLAVHPADRLAQ
jgi:mRNA-degrading endonuclease RelE of RelBE toxin-antitoxin system